MSAVRTYCRVIALTTEVKKVKKAVNYIARNPAALEQS